MIRAQLLNDFQRFQTDSPPPPKTTSLDPTDTIRVLDDRVETIVRFSADQARNSGFPEALSPPSSPLGIDDRRAFTRYVVSFF